MVYSSNVFRPPALALIALAVPTLSFGTSARWDSEARAIGGRLGRAVAALVPNEARSGAPVTMDGPDVVSSAGDDRDESVVSFIGQAPAKAGSRRSHGKEGQTGHGVLVTEGTVLRLARGGVVPEGRPVEAASARPPGIELSRVSALGIGVHDGDVLTEVAGHPVRSEGQVVGAVLALRARRAASISAVFYRGRERWSLVVEMPYPPGS